MPGIPRMLIQDNQRCRRFFLHLCSSNRILLHLTAGHALTTFVFQKLICDWAVPWKSLDLIYMCTNICDCLWFLHWINPAAVWWIRATKTGATVLCKTGWVVETTCFRLKISENWYIVCIWHNLFKYCISFIFPSSQHSKAIILIYNLTMNFTHALFLIF